MVMATMLRLDLMAGWYRQRREPEGHDELRAEDKDEERDGKEEGCRS
jgi:hypothetical protein